MQRTVLTQHTLSITTRPLCDVRYQSSASNYAHTMRCPVLKLRMAVPGVREGLCRALLGSTDSGEAFQVSQRACAAVWHVIGHVHCDKKPCTKIESEGMLVVALVLTGACVVPGHRHRAGLDAVRAGRKGGLRAVE